MMMTLFRCPNAVLLRVVSRVSAHAQTQTQTQIVPLWGKRFTATSATIEAKNPAKVALTHSTYVDGLLPFLDSIRHVQGIFALHPGEIRTCKAHYEKFSVRISSVRDNGMCSVVFPVCIIGEL